jgi:hypothetical protein
MVMSNEGRNPLGVTDSERILFDYILGPADKQPGPVFDEDEVSSGPITLQNVFQHHDAHPVIFDLILSQKYDVEWLDWDQDALRLEIQEDFNTTISQLNWAKIQTLRSLHSSELFWTEWNVFSALTSCLNNNIPDFEMLVLPDIEQIMVSVDIANVVRSVEFSDEVAWFVVACAIDDGINYLPEPLDFAAPYLAEPMYRCKDCGYEAPVDIEPVRCDNCTGRFTDGHPFNDKPDPDAPKKSGKNVEVFFRRDPGKTAELWGAHKEDTIESLAQYADLEKYPEYVPFFKLLSARDYVEHRREQLSTQRKALGL